MKYLLTVALAVLLASDIFDLSLSLGPGVSVKNALLYGLALLLILRFVIKGDFVLEKRGLIVCLAVLFGYGLLSSLVAAFVIKYPGYDLMASIIRLKALHFDFLAFFLVFFYAIRTLDEAKFMLMTLLGASVVANVVTLMDVYGIVDIEAIGLHPSGRVNGAIGEKNQHAAFTALFVPGLLAAAVVAHALSRVGWMLCALISLMILLTTVSRGAYVALLMAAIWGAFAFRRYLSPGRLMGWMVGGALGVALIVGVISIQFGPLVEERLAAMVGPDRIQATGGRSYIWASFLQRMAETPISFITGFGWNAETTMHFIYPPHNEYLNYWFMMGLPGVVCFIGMFYFAVRAAAGATALASAAERPFLIGFCIGTVALASAALFTGIYQPWAYFWVYTGVMMRYASCIEARRVKRAQPAQAAEAQLEPFHRDRFGWQSREGARGT